METGRRFVLLLMLFAVTLVTACSSPARRAQERSMRSLLSELDGYVAARDVYVTRKLDQVEALRKMAAAAREPGVRFETEMRIADEFFAFNFDSTQARLKHCQALASAMGDKERYDRASIQLGHLYAKAGSYMEAYNLFYDQIDTASLSEARRTDYLLALYDFSKDLSGNSGMVERFDIPEAAAYRPVLMQRLPRDSENWRVLRRDELIEQGQLSAADSLGRLLLAATNPEEHAYAIHAWYLSDIAERMGRPADQMTWLVRSAESDIINAVKDYASLTMVAQNIINQDVARSFRYLRTAEEDALFYNAKLRPWQISRFMMQVEDAYDARQERQRKASEVLSILLAVLTAALAVLAWFFIVRSRKLSRLRKQLEDSNAQLALANATLAELNREISQADQVKEQYILSFLESLSKQIHLFREEDNLQRNLLKRGRTDQLLRDLADSSRSEKAREEFYRTFDTTFLAMYPDFVERFNELLQEDARFRPPKGKLTTELRIFALIRLGVDDSKRIAAMLDYSLSTIYNYKVSVKNHAAGDRESFEERVKMIGK